MDLACPLCGYSLYGLPEPRCPECGYQFEWPALIAQQRLKAQWFHEHLGSFASHLKTRWRSLRASSFWTTVQPAWQIHVGRLVRYHATTFLALVLPYVLITPSIPIRLIGESFSYWPMRYGAIAGKPGYITMSYPPSDFRISLLSFLRWFPNIEAKLFPTVVMIVITLTLLPAFWLLLRATTAQQQIRPAQLWRVTVYVSDVLPIALVATGTLLYLAVVRFNGRMTVLFPLVMLSPLALLAWVSVRLSTALRRYLQLEKAGQIVAAFVIIFGLLFIVVLLNTSASFGFTLLASR